MRATDRPRPSTGGTQQAHHDSTPRRPLVEVLDLRVELGGKLVLEVPDLDIQKSETLAVIGPNGAGKSTLISVLGMLQTPSAGKVSIDGRPVYTPSPVADLVALRRRTAVVFQEPLLTDNSVFDNVALGLRLRGVAGNELSDRVARWMGRFGIAKLADRQARTLSGGEAQRTSLARAFVLAPQLLLLDEPFARLDPATRAAVELDVQRAIIEAGTTTLLVTHDRDEALVFGSRVAVLIAGRVAQIGPPEVVFSQPADAEVAEVVGVENVVPGVVDCSIDGLAIIKTAEFEITAVAAAVNGNHVLVCIRPDDVTLTRPEEVVSSARNRIYGVIETISPRGAVAQVVVRAGQTQLAALVTRASLQDLGLRPGQRAVAQFKATAVHLIPQRR